MKKTTILRITAAFAAVLMLSGTFTSCRKSGEDEDTTEEATTEEETTAEVKGPEFQNPLTGLEAASDFSAARPVSIMINNIRESLPQEGIAQADIMYECLAEGGITRLMMICTDYAKLAKVGSVRSARDYYIDYAESYDCIFIHAGGSNYAYSAFSERNTDHIDGVKGPAALFYTTNTFIRDPERMKNFSSEHTMMVQNGEGITAAIDYYKFRTAKNAGYETPVNFAKWGEKTELSGKAAHIGVRMSSYQKVDYNYDAATGKYLRFQYDGEKHIDNTTGEQLSFDNVILMYTATAAIAGDEKDRINVTTTGSGEGLCFTAGTYQKIKWEKPEHASVIKYYLEDGSELCLNRGKTMINVVPEYEADGTVIDDNLVAAKQ